MPTSALRSIVNAADDETPSPTAAVANGDHADNRASSPRLRSRDTLERTCSEVEQDAELEAVLLAAIDVDEDSAQLVPMPGSIPAALRRSLTRRFAQRFEFMEDLHEWLHREHEALGGTCPLERLVAGDGWSVLQLLHAE